MDDIDWVQEWERGLGVFQPGSWAAMVGISQLFGPRGWATTVRTTEGVRVHVEKLMDVGAFASRSQLLHVALSIGVAALWSEHKDAPQSEG
jgi:hypothetical protein